MIIKLRLKFRPNWCSLTSNDLPGLLLCGELNEVLADFVKSWKKLHDVAPHQVMPVPKTVSMRSNNKRRSNRIDAAKRQK